MLRSIAGCIAVNLHGTGVQRPSKSGRPQRLATRSNKSHEERTRLRAELDGLIAHLYGLTEEEFAHMLATFPVVPDPVKVAAQNAYRDVERGLIR